MGIAIHGGAIRYRPVPVPIQDAAVVASEPSSYVPESQRTAGVSVQTAQVSYRPGLRQPAGPIQNSLADPVSAFVAPIQGLMRLFGPKAIWSGASLGITGLPQPRATMASQAATEGAVPGTAPAVLYAPNPRLGPATASPTGAGN